MLWESPGLGSFLRRASLPLSRVRRRAQPTGIIMHSSSMVRPGRAGTVDLHLVCAPAICDPYRLRDVEQRQTLRGSLTENLESGASVWLTSLLASTLARHSPFELTIRCQLSST